MRKRVFMYARVYVRPCVRTYALVLMNLCLHASVIACLCVRTCACAHLCQRTLVCACCVHVCVRLCVSAATRACMMHSYLHVQTCVCGQVSMSVYVRMFARASVCLYVYDI
jgi:hypothetical protein